LEEQLELQVKNFKPPHPENAMVSEELLRGSTPDSVDSEPKVNGVNGIEGRH
jgi:CTP synthase